MLSQRTSDNPSEIPWPRRSRGVPAEDVLPGPVPGTLLIPLTRGKFALIDAADFDLIRGYKWYCDVSQAGKHYARCGFWQEGKVKSLRMHRLILGVPTETEVDHRNGDGLDNRRRNLRVATTSDNNCNRVSGRRKSPYRGLYLNRHGKWTARCKKNGLTRKSASFGCPEDAARAYDQMAREMHGAFAFINFPEMSNG